MEANWVLGLGNEVRCCNEGTEARHLELLSGARSRVETCFCAVVNGSYLVAAFRVLLAST